MPLQAPILDDRNFEQLLEEARLRIPLYTPEWTNFNDSDPGMALVQLFAWFTELMLYKMNQVPNRLYIKFLKMLNLELRPAQPARTHVVFIPGPEAKLTTVSERTRFDVDVGEEGVPFFETLSAFDLCPFKLDRVQVFDGTRYRDVTTANETGTLTYKPFGPAAQLGSALYLGFKPQEPKNRREQFPERMLFRFFYPKFADQPDGAAYTARSGPSVTTLQRLVWEYRSEYDRVGNRPPQQWRQLATIDDKTLALTKEGDVLIHGPREDIVPTIEGELTSEGEGPRDEAPEDGEAKRYWLRLRLAQGAYSNDKIPHISFVQTNVVEVENLTTLTDEELGQSDGRPDQTFTLGNRPVDKDSLEIVVEVPNRREPDSWNRVDDFLASQRTARHYTLNPTTGEIKFGDGKHGLIPEPGGIIRAMRYRYGGGENGNVKPDTITAIPGSLAGIESVTNPRAARGGKPEEDLKDLIRRAPLALRSGGRAVTNNDFRQIAEAVPGVLKAHVAPGYHPAYPGHPIPGAVTVFIVPDTLRTERGGGLDDFNLVPSQELREAVYQKINEVRLVTTEVIIAAPDYRRVTIEATVILAPNVTSQQAKTELPKALSEYFRLENIDFGLSFYPTYLYKVLLERKEPKTQATILEAVNHLVVQVTGTESSVHDLNFRTSQPKRDSGATECNLAPSQESTTSTVCKTEIKKDQEVLIKLKPNELLVFDRAEIRINPEGGQ